MKRRTFLKLALISALSPTTAVKMIPDPKVPVYGYNMKWEYVIKPLTGAGISGNSLLVGDEEQMALEWKRVKVRVK